MFVERKEPHAIIPSERDKCSYRLGNNQKSLKIVSEVTKFNRIWSVE